jgi:hypothetical protein
MTTQEAKAYLNQAREAERAYRLARDKANSYAQLIMGGKAVKYDSDSSTHEKNGNTVERTYCCLADYQAEADRLMMEMLGVRQQVEKVIGTVPDAVQREVLTRRYIIGQRWEDIAFVMNYNVRHIYKIHGAALQSMALNGTITL